MNTSKNIGIVGASPSGTCKDVKCPFHGHLKVRGRKFTGTVVSSKMQHTVVVEWEWTHYIPKFERYEKKRTRIKAHNPSCVAATEGDVITISECRPLSKTKNFVIVQNHGKERGYSQKQEARQMSKFEKKKKELSDDKETEE